MPKSTVPTSAARTPARRFRTLAAAYGLVLDIVPDLTDQRCLLEFRLLDG